MVDPVENPAGQQEIGSTEQGKFVDTTRQLLLSPNGKGSIIPKFIQEAEGVEVAYEKNGYRVDVFAKNGSLLETDLTMGRYPIN